MQTKPTADGRTADMAAAVTAHDLATGAAAGETALRFEPYWWDAAPRAASAAGELPKTCDVLVVGSGFTGLSAALTLLDKGRSVIVVDSGCPGFGASTRNGGQVGSGNQKFRVQTLIALRGRAKATAMLREGTEMLAYIADLIARENIQCAFRRCGRFRGAIRPEHYEAMARDLDDLKEIAGVESFMVPKAEQHTEIGTDAFYGGSVLPNDASLHPGLYHAGLMQRIAAKGGVIIGNAAVTAIAAEAAQFRVTTRRGGISARNVIVATNGYSGDAVPELKRRIVPVGSGLIATAEIPQRIFDRLFPKQRVYGNTNRVFYYFRPAPDARRIIWGGRVGRLAPAHAPRAYAHLAADMLSVFPQLEDVPVTHAWDGLIGYTYDEIPHLGRTTTGIHFALGYCGTGVSRATYFGHKIALQVTGDRDGRTAFDDLAFPEFPAHAIARHAVPVVETWYRLRDALGL